MCIYSYMRSKFGHLQSTLYLMWYIYPDVFFHGSKQFINSILMPLSVSAVFCFTLLPHWQNISLWGLFSQGKQQKGCLAKSGEWEGWAEGSSRFWSITAELNAVWAGVLVNHPSLNGQMHWKNLKKNSLKPNAASYNNAS